APARAAAPPGLEVHEPGRDRHAAGQRRPRAALQRGARAPGGQRDVRAAAADRNARPLLPALRHALVRRVGGRAAPDRRMRRALSLLLLALGVVLCSSAGRIYAKAALAQVLLRQGWGEARAGDAEPRPWPWADMWPVARLQIPAHGVDLIVIEGATGSTTAFAPGHILGTAAPGERGNVGIAA